MYNIRGMNSKSSVMSPVKLSPFLMDSCLMSRFPLHLWPWVYMHTQIDPSFISCSEQKSCWSIFQVSTSWQELPWKKKLFNDFCLCSSDTICNKHAIWESFWRTCLKAFDIIRYVKWILTTRHRTNATKVIHKAGYE